LQELLRILYQWRFFWVESESGRESNASKRHQRLCLWFPSLPSVFSQFIWEKRETLSWKRLHSLLWMTVDDEPLFTSIILFRLFFLYYWLSNRKDSLVL
jgi:hypothetical protein